MSKKKTKVYQPVSTPESKCTRCGKGINRATGIGSPVPKEGDVSICVQCGQVMRFRTDLTLRTVSGEELRELKTYLRAHQPDTLQMLEFSQRYFIAGRARREN